MAVRSYQSYCTLLHFLCGFSFSFSFLAGLHSTACQILAPGPGIEPVPPAVKVWSPNHWTTLCLFFWPGSDPWPLQSSIFSRAGMAGHLLYFHVVGHFSSQWWASSSLLPRQTPNIGFFPHGENSILIKLIDWIWLQGREDASVYSLCSWPDIFRLRVSRCVSFLLSLWQMTTNPVVFVKATHKYPLICLWLTNLKSVSLG